jgi:acetylornithine/N-succinyldiaminopimelate aminotransferase
VISTQGGFHGRSFNTLSVSRGVDNTSRYLPQLPDICFVPHGDTNALAWNLDHQTAAVIVEPIQGEGGVRIPPGSWLAEVQFLCRQHGALLIVDEIQTGFCRTGKFFALEHSSQTIKPDFMTMAKGIAGGFPFAAFAVSSEVNALLQKDDHGGTYCGNPLGCAISHTVVNYLQEHAIADKVQQSGKLLMEALLSLQAEFPHLINDVRGLGLICALEFREPALARQLTARCAELGLLVVPTRNGIIRLLPDLLVSADDIGTAIALLRAALQTTDQ